MKKKFEVRVRCIQEYDVVVEAEDAEAATILVEAMSSEEIDREGDYVDGGVEVDYVEEHDGEEE